MAVGMEFLLRMSFHSASSVPADCDCAVIWHRRIDRTAAGSHFQMTDTLRHLAFHLDVAVADILLTAAAADLVVVDDVAAEGKKLKMSVDAVNQEGWNCFDTLLLS